MGSYLADHTVTVFPFTQKPEGEETIIANATNTVFLSLPSSAVDILHWLAQGKTIREAQTLYAQRYDEVPDVEDFLELLESEGFVSSTAETPLDGNITQTSQTNSSALSASDKTRHYHFTSITQKVASRIFSLPVLLCCVLCIAVGLLCVALDSSVIPSPEILIFKHNLTLMSIGLYLLLLPAVFLHEMAHLVAARAAGVPARLGISHRLWTLVAQTDMTGIWMASKRQRLLAVLAGSLLDATVASLLIMLLFAQHRGWVPLPSPALLFLRIALFTYLLRLLWECFLFVRTDFYYVIVILFNCKDLMGDTEIFLRNQCARFLPFIHQVDQTSVPPREMRVVRSYALIWIFGRLVAFLSLIFIGLPILLGYYFEIGTYLLRGQVPASIAPADIIGWIIFIAVTSLLQTFGFVLWFRSLYLAMKGNHGKHSH